jgi:protein SCO1
MIQISSVGRALPRAALALVCAGALLGCHRERELPDYGAVPPFAMVDQSGKPFSDQTMRGKTWAAAFVFTRCPSACPRVTKVMRNVQVQAAEHRVELRLVSFTVDPDNDTPEVLLRYAGEYGADLSSWSFVTGDARAVKETAERGFKVAVDGTADPSKADFGITHGTQLVLVDRNARIRGYYTTADEQAQKDLVNDANVLASRR